MQRNSIQVIQLYALDPLSQDCQERFVLRAALGSEYLSTAESSEHLVVIDNADFPPGCYDQGSSLVASGREDGSVVLWRRDQKNPIASLKGQLPKRFFFWLFVIGTEQLFIMTNRTHWCCQ